MEFVGQNERNNYIIMGAVSGSTKRVVVYKLNVVGIEILPLSTRVAPERPRVIQVETG